MGWPVTQLKKRKNTVNIWVSVWFDTLTFVRTFHGWKSSNPNEIIRKLTKSASSNLMADQVIVWWCFIPHPHQVFFQVFALKCHRYVSNSPVWLNTKTSKKQNLPYIQDMLTIMLQLMILMLKLIVQPIIQLVDSPIKWHPN